MLFNTFLIDDFLIAIDTRHVLEVLPEKPITRVPKSNPWISGLLNFRGEILTTFDLTRIFTLSKSTPNSKMNVVVQSKIDDPNQKKINFLVSSIEDVIEIDLGKIHPPPVHLSAKIKHFVTGTITKKNRIIMVIDVSKTIENIPSQDTPDTE